MLSAHVASAPAAYTPAKRANDDSVEFSVEAEEDLVLVGSARDITRVAKANAYPCLMMKNQKFSSLFRHYAKRHGLPQDNLEFYFTERVRADDTPDSVHLQKNDVIRVRARQQQRGAARCRPA